MRVLFLSCLVFLAAGQQLAEDGFSMESFLNSIDGESPSNSNNFGFDSILEMDPCNCQQYSDKQPPFKIKFTKSRFPTKCYKLVTKADLKQYPTLAHTIQKNIDSFVKSNFKREKIWQTQDGSYFRRNYLNDNVGELSQEVKIRVDRRKIQVWNVLVNACL